METNEVQFDGNGNIIDYLSGKTLVDTPEERVRQRFRRIYSASKDRCNVTKMRIPQFFPLYTKSPPSCPYQDGRRGKRKENFPIHFRFPLKSSVYM